MDNTSSDLIGQRNLRIGHLKELRALGINPYPSESIKEYANHEVVSNFERLKGKTMTLAGRIMNKREHGKLIFADLQDQSGVIQIAIKKDDLKEDLESGNLSWGQLKLIDVGDIIQVSGTLDKTVQGEISIFVERINILTKSIRPMPTNLDDKEQQFRRRYVDLVLNLDRKEQFMRKAKFYEVNRQFLKDHGFVELETPVLERVTGGADATPFTTHHNALDQDFFLRISTELYQKRLIGGGFEKIFVIGPNFRNEGLSDEHLQEYYQIEWYWAYANFQDNMNMLKDMFKHIALEVYGKTKFTTHGHTFDLADDWEEIDYQAAIQDRFGVDIFKTDQSEMIKK
ncbi:lysine--tRNA ligase, partial [Candidatus Roizmanbacteria bacterium CG11_big_fil_rev_8_21_14_0_20_36_8]